MVEAHTHSMTVITTCLSCRDPIASQPSLSPSINKRPKGPRRAVVVGCQPRARSTGAGGRASNQQEYTHQLYSRRLAPTACVSRATCCRTFKVAQPLPPSTPYQMQHDNSISPATSAPGWDTGSCHGIPAPAQESRRQPLEGNLQGTPRSTCQHHALACRRPLQQTRTLTRTY